MNTVKLSKSDQLALPVSDIRGYVDSASAWDASRLDSLEKSRRIAWRVAALACGVVVLCAAAIVLMMPLKQTTPYVIRVDGNGVPTLVTVMEDKKVTGEQVDDKYWLARLVDHYYRYNFHTLTKDYQTVGYLTSPDVGSEYAAQFEGPNALNVVQADKIRTNVTILSVVLDGQGVGTVRFMTETLRTKTQEVINVSRYVATISYEYNNQQRTDDDVRLINPFGFMARTLRLDPEYLGGEL